MIFLLALFLLFAPQHDPCTLFDTWVGGERVSELATMPADAVVTRMIFPKASIWRYYDIQNDTAYIKVYVDRQQVCVYKLRGSGMGLPEFDVDGAAA